MFKLEPIIQISFMVNDVNKLGLIVSQTCVALITLNMSQIFKSGFAQFWPFNGKFHQMF